MENCRVIVASNADYTTLRHAFATALAEAGVSESSMLALPGTRVEPCANRKGVNIHFETLDDVSVNGVVIVPNSSLVIATVTAAQEKRRMGRGGKLGINIDYLRLATGETSAEGRSKY